MSAYGSSSNSQWSHLPSHILKLISNRLNNDHEQGSSDNYGSLSIHNLRLRSVCKSWRSSIPAREKKPKPTILPLPTFRNPELISNPCEDHVTLSQSTIYLLQHHQTQSMNCIEPYWLLRVKEETSSGNRSGEKWHPLNLLSRTLGSDDVDQKRIVLPKGFPKSINVLDFRVVEIGRAYDLDFVPQISQKGDINELESVHIDKVVVSSTPFATENNDAAASEADNLAVMAIYRLKLGFIKLGDKKWIPVDDPTESNCSDVVFHKGKFYAIDYRGRVVSIGPDLKPKEISRGVSHLRSGGEYKKLVTCCSDLFMIDTFFEPERFLVYDPLFEDNFGRKFGPVRFYKLNKENEEWEQVFDLNNHVFFVGYDCSYSVFAQDFAGLKPNCVYYSYDDSYRESNEENNLGELFTGIVVYDIDAGTCGPLSSFPDHWHIFRPPRTLRMKENKMHVDGSYSQWSDLPCDLLELLAKRLNNNLDQGSSDNCGSLSIHNLRLRSVCKSWRSFIPARKKKAAPTILPGIGSNHFEGHFNLSQSTIYLLHQHRKHQKPIRNSIGPYWLLRIEEETSSGSSSGAKWRPLNPLSRNLTTKVDDHRRLLLPEGFPESINVLDFRIYEIGRAFNLDFVSQTSQKCNIRIDKVVVSSIPFMAENNNVAASDADNLVVMAICGLKLGFVKLGDKKWTPIDDPKNSNFLDVIFHKGKFYAVDDQGRVVSIGPDLKAKEVAPGVSDLCEGEYEKLVTCCGDLFMIDTIFEPEDFVGQDPSVGEYIGQESDPVRLKIYKLDEETKEWEQVFDLNDHVFFVGYDCSYSVSAQDFAGLEPDCVYYFVDDTYMVFEEENTLGEFFTGIGVYDMDAYIRGPLSNFSYYWHIFMPPLTLRKLKKAIKSREQG